MNQAETMRERRLAWNNAVDELHQASERLRSLQVQASTAVRQRIDQREVEHEAWERAERRDTPADWDHADQLNLALDQEDARIRRLFTEVFDAAAEQKRLLVVERNLAMEFFEAYDLYMDADELFEARRGNEQNEDYFPDNESEDNPS